MDEQPQMKLLDIVLRRWPIIVIAFVVTTSFTLLWVLSKPNVYESSGAYVVRPQSDQGEDTVRALEALIRGTQINATYALIARSDAIQDPAEARLAEAPVGARLNIDAEAVTGTNALSIRARASDAETAQALAVAAGVETIAYVDRLGEPYELVLLDPPELPSGPVETRKPLTIALGALLGLLLGIGLAAMLDRIAALRETRRIEPETVAEPVGTNGAGDLVADATADPGVRRKMRQVARRAPTYSVGVLRLAQANQHGNGNGSSARFAELLRNQVLHNGRTLTYLREGLFAVVLPNMSAVAASKLLSDWLAGAGDLGGTTDDEHAGLQIAIAVLEYDGTSIDGETSDVATG